jgi:3-dehydroquinate synthase
MVMASDLSADLGLIPRASAHRLQQLIAKAGLPVQAPAMPTDQWFELMSVDKKATDGDIRYVLLEGEGQAVVQAAPRSTVEALILRHSAGGASSA